jgi:SAM-dependent methyltransferase
VELDEYRRNSRQAWGSVAPAWERWRTYAEACWAPVREWMLREVGPRPGDTVLELSAGGGETGLQAAAAVGDTGRLISTDFSPEMVEAARRRGAALGVANAEFRVLDAERLDLGAASVDRVLCRFGYMLMADPAAALAETRRVLRRGGRVALAVWGPAERNPWSGVRAQLLVERGYLPPPEPGAPGPFTMGSEDRIRELLGGAGLRALRLEEVAVRFPFRDLDEYVTWGSETAPGFASVVAQASADELAALRAELGQRLSPYATPEGLELPGVTLCAAAGPT